MTAAAIEGNKMTVPAETATAKDGIGETRKRRMNDPLADGMTPVADIQNDGDDEMTEIEAT